MTLKENVETDNLYSMFSTECKSNEKTTEGDIGNYYHIPSCILFNCFNHHNNHTWKRGNTGGEINLNR